MHEISSAGPAAGDADWQKLAPVLDQAIGELAERDRDAVVLRFFEGRPFAEIGATLRLTEDAARMRVERALDKLRAALGRRGITSTTAALGVALANQAAAIAPAGIAASVTGAALSGAAAASGGVALATFMGMTKIQAGIAAALCAAGAADFGWQAQTNAALRRELAGAQQEVQAGLALRVENTRLKRVTAEAETARANVAELTKLHDESAALRARLQTAHPVAPLLAGSGMPARTLQPFTGEAYIPSQVDVKPKVTSQNKPFYPAELRGFQLDVEVTIDFIVDAEGAVRNVVARNAAAVHPLFAGAAVNAVNWWKFEPAQKDGHTVATRMAVPIIFTNSAQPTPTPAPPNSGSTPRPVPWF
jgi:TonB family protein